MVATLSAAAPAARAPGLHAQLETLPRETLQQLQLQRLQETLRNAWENVPWHQQRLRAAGLGDLRDLASLDDLRRLPFTVKTDLRDNYPVRPVHPPGAAAGAAARFVGHHRQADRGGLHRAGSVHLVRPGGALAALRRRAPGDLVHNAYGYGLFTGGLGAHDGAGRLGCRWCRSPAAAPSARWR